MARVRADAAAARSPASTGAAKRRRLLRALEQAEDAAALDIAGDVVQATHLDRVYWPPAPSLGAGAVTKRAFLRYLVRLAPKLLPFLADRPLTPFRWPEGIAGRRVLMKHWETALPSFVERVTVFSESKGRGDRYLVCNNLATLLWLGQMGTLELHAWHSRVRPGADARGAHDDFASSLRALQSSVLERPDYVLFDIDPFIYSGRETRTGQPEFTRRGFERSRLVALRVKELLDGIGLASYVKTSGKTGLHVVVPIVRTLRYDAVRELARHVGAYLAHAHRDAITVDWSIERRAGKVFIDANMNVRGKSITAPYSPRGLAGAPVSMPLRWEDLERADPLEYRIDTSDAWSARGDPWAEVLSAKQDVGEALGGGKAA